jgi:hypothetical protein
MKQSLILLLVLFTLNKINAQEIEATTAGGKKVMLNLDNYSWRYVNQQDGQKPCYTNYTADVLIKNKTNHDVYFHYAFTNKSTNKNFGGGVIKIPANSEKPIERLFTKFWTNTRDSYINTYEWKVSYEQFNIYNSTWSEYSLNEVKGFDNGTFILYECEVKTIEIN